MRSFAFNTSIKASTKKIEENKKEKPAYIKQDLVYDMDTG
jgi:hypothetical protein